MKGPLNNGNCVVRKLFSNPQNYSSVDSLMTQSRLTMLKSVQALTEIQEFLGFIKGDGE